MNLNYTRIVTIIMDVDDLLVNWSSRDDLVVIVTIKDVLLV